MENWFYYKTLDLPKVPEHIVAQALDLAHDPDRCVPEKSLRYTPEKNIVRTYWFRPVDVFGETHPSRSVIRFDVGTEFGQWVKENITDDFLDASLACSMSVKDNFADTVTGMHTDTTRSYLLMYVIEKTNDDQKTIWWQERGYPIVRENDLQIDHFNTVEQIEEAVFEQNRWVLMNARILHSVHNIKGNRFALHVSLTDDQALKILR